MSKHTPNPGVVSDDLASSLIVARKLVDLPPYAQRQCTEKPKHKNIKTKYTSKYKDKYIN